MAERFSLTRLAHEAVAAVVAPGDQVLDATAGNGWDSLCLARLVGPQGHVHAFDIQPAAIAATRRRLADAGVLDRVSLYLQDHARLDACLPSALRRRLAAAMFNLGYLPGGDKMRITQTATTLAALEQAAAWLRPGGMLSIIAYPGHAGGREEFNAVRSWLAGRPDLVQVTAVDSGHAISPVLFILRNPQHDPRHQRGTYSGSGRRL